MSVLSSISNAAKRGLRRGLQRVGNNIVNRALDAEEGGQRSTHGVRPKIWLIGILFAFFMMASVVVIVKRGIVITVQSTADKVASLFNTDADVAHMSAGQLYDMLKDAENVGVNIDDELALIDRETLLKILKRIDERNAVLTSTKEVTYEYRVADGELLSFDEITGEYTLGPLTVIETKFRDVEVEEKVKAPLSYDDIYKEYVSKGLQPPPRDVIAGAYKWETVKTIVQESYEEESEVEPTETTYTTTETLDRTTVERDNLLLGDIFSIRWQSVFALCSMYIEMRTDSESDDALLEEGGNGVYKLTDDEIDSLIDVFAFDYYFYDDATIEEQTDFTYDCYKKRVYAYKLKVSPDISLVRTCLRPDTLPLTSLTVYHVPSIAPRLLVNSYIKYVYEYEELENGYMVLSARTSECKPVALISACAELIPDFDIEDFYEHLEYIDGSEDIIAYYKDMFARGDVSERVNERLECPLIGTILSMDESSVAYAKIYSYNRMKVTTSKLSDEDITINVSYDGGGSSSFDYGLNTYGGEITGLDEKDLADPWFASVVSTAEQFLGLPYIWGGKTTAGFDCSGFTNYVMRQNGVEFSGNSVSMYNNQVIKLSKEQRRPGDLIFFHFDGGKLTGDRKKDEPTHVGIYLGSGMMVHSCQSKGVEYRKLDGTSYETHILSYGRHK